MESELNIEVTEVELEYRINHYHELRALKLRELSCTTCGNVLGHESEEVFAHPIFGILQCRKCNHRVKDIFDSDDASISCHICTSVRKNSYKCSRENCSFKFCKACIKRNVPQSLAEAESQKWKCFVCNLKPLWKLRGVCAAVMNSIPKRTKRKKVSRNRSSDRDDKKSDLRNISYVRTRRLTEAKELSKRLSTFCDEESPAQNTEPLRPLFDRNTRRTKEDHFNANKKLESYFGYGNESSGHLTVITSSEDSDIEERKPIRRRYKEIPTVKSQRDKPLETARKSITDLRKNLRNYKFSTNTKESRYNVSMNSHRLSTSSNSESSKNDDSDLEAFKRVLPSSFRKQKSKADDKSSEARKMFLTEGGSDDDKKCMRKKRKDSSTNDVTMSNHDKSIKLTGDSKKSVNHLDPIMRDTSDSESPRETRMSSKNVARNTKSKQNDGEPKKIVRDDDRSRKSTRNDERSKKSRRNSNSLLTSRRENSSPESDEDSDESTTIRTTQNRQSGKVYAIRNENEIMDEKSRKFSDHQHTKSQKAASDSSSGKEFRKSKLCRSSCVPLRPIAELEQDYTRSPDQNPEKPKDLISKDQTFVLKNYVTKFFAELKKAADKLVSDIEHAHTKYCMKEFLRTTDADRLILETKNVVTTLKDCVNRGECKMDDYYEKWCKKTRVKNVLKTRRLSNKNEKPSSSSKQSEKKSSNGNEESENESSASPRLASPSRLSNESTNPVDSAIVNGSSKRRVVSDCDNEEIFSCDETRILGSKNDSNSPSRRSHIVESAEPMENKTSRNISSDETGDGSTIEPKDIDVPTVENQKYKISNRSSSSLEISAHSVIKTRPEEENARKLPEKSISSNNLRTSRESIDPSDVDIFEVSMESLDHETNEQLTSNNYDEQDTDAEKKSCTKDSLKPKRSRTKNNDKDSLTSRTSEANCLQKRTSSVNSRTNKRKSDSESSDGEKCVNKISNETATDNSSKISSDTESIPEVPVDYKVQLNQPEVVNNEIYTKSHDESLKNCVDNSSFIEQPSKPLKKIRQSERNTEEIGNMNSSLYLRTTGDEKELLEQEIPTQNFVENEKNEDDNVESIYSLDAVVGDGNEDQIEGNSRKSLVVDDSERRSSLSGESGQDSNDEQLSLKSSPEINNSDRQSSIDTVFADNLERTTDKSLSSLTSSNPSETDNLRIRDMLLLSSNSDESSVEDSLTLRNSSTLENNNRDIPSTLPESDSNSGESTTIDTIEHDCIAKQQQLLRTRRNKFRIENNPYLMADKQLHRRCEVRLKRLEKKILNQHLKPLKKSRDYLDSKKLKRLVALDKLDKKKQVTKNSGSEDDDAVSSKDLKIKKKGQATKEREETLLDHFEKIKNGKNIDLTNESDAESSDKDKGDKSKPDDKSEDSMLAEADRMAKKRLLESSDSAGEEHTASESRDKDDEEEKDEKVKKTKKITKNETSEKSPEHYKKQRETADKGRWRKNKILTLRISDSDSEEEKNKFDLSQEMLSDKKKNEASQSDSEEERSPKKKRVRRRVLHSDSDIQVSPQSESECSDDSIKRKKKKKRDSDDDEKKKTRKRIRRGERSSGSSDSMDDKRLKNRRKRIKAAESDSDSDLDNSHGTPGKSGRKNIRKVIRDKQVADDTKQAAKAEEERLQRIAERQKLYNQMYESRLAGEEKVEKLVLDFDEETKEPLVSVDEALVKRLKPHQAQGIKFMWDACFESLERTKTTKGSGCILAHCMGLGKTFQIVALSHTLLQHPDTGMKTIMVVCPLSTVLNWVNEFKIWLEELPDGDDIEVYELTRMKKNFERKYQLQRWQKTGGVMIIGYEMFRNLSSIGKKVRKNIQDVFLKCLVDPGPDLIVCDEGHLLKNEDTALSKAMRRVRTLRRIVLTGTPLQNNLIEYHCMVQFVKPNLLGTKKEFTNRFENPITNGQFDDSTEYDVRLMKKRAHVLHKMLEGSVQRLDYSVLTPFLPPKQEYVIFVKLTDIQIKMYRHYLDNYARRHRGVGGSLFADFQALQRIWTHPRVMRMNAKKVELANEKKRLDATDSEGSLRDFIDDGSDSATSDSSDVRSMSDSNEDTRKNPKRGTRANPVPDQPPLASSAIAEKTEDSNNVDVEWWTQFVKDDDYDDMRISSKLLILFRILKESHSVGDKVLVFSQSLYSLTLIEEFLRMIDDETQNGNDEPDHLDKHTGSWSLGLDYFRLDGQSSTDNRRRWCDIFNKSSNTRARLFLISTRAGGLGINLTAANRVIIFDASWNPSHDVQSIFRIYRFGQKKPCYVYRLLAAGTMEEKIYNRQVTKLSLSCRVVDEQQIERHYSNNALAELYKLEISETEITLNLPKDRLLAEIFLQYKHCVENYHEHDSLLENQAGEELDEEERQQAWLEYEEEKKGKRLLPPNPFMSYQNEIMMQQANLMNLAQQNPALGNPAMMLDYENIKQMMSKDYPGVSEAQQKAMATRTVYEMYNYVERQAMATHNPMAMMNMAAGQVGFDNRMGQQTATLPHPTPEMMRLYQRSLAHQQNGQMNYPINHGIMGDSLGNVRNTSIPQMAQLPSQLSASSSNADDDIVEIPSSPEKNHVPPPPTPGGSRKSQEE